MIKLIVSDLDGTLCDDTHSLSKMTASYIRKLQQVNMPFMLATGRDMSIVKPLFDTFHFQCPLIALNGAILYDQDGSKQKEQCIGTNVVATIYEVLKKETFLTWYTKFGNYCTNPDAYYQKLKSLYTDSKKQARFEKEHGFVQFTQSLSMETMWKEECVYKIDVYTCSPQVLQALNEIPAIQVSSSSNGIIEITRQGISKGNMLLEYCEEHAITKQHVLTFGDSENDLEMLTQFPYGHMMRNAKEELLEKVNYIAPYHNQDGVIKVIENFTGITIDKVCEE